MKIRTKRNGILDLAELRKNSEEMLTGNARLWPENTIVDLLDALEAALNAPKPRSMDDVRQAAGVVKESAIAQDGDTT